MLDAKTILETLIEKVNNEDYHTEGETGNSCIDVPTLLNWFNKISEQVKEPERGTFHCCKCGGTDIHLKEWTHANNRTVFWGVIDEDDNPNNNWCETCQDHTEIEYTPHP
jgi:hypothetical protein